MSEGLFSAMEGRVVGYREVIERAAEIRRALRLPATLDARLYSLGVAESELSWSEPRGACQCWPRCGDQLARSLAAQRAAAERRLRASGYLTEAAA